MSFTPPPSLAAGGSGAARRLRSSRIGPVREWHPVGVATLLLIVLGIVAMALALAVPVGLVALVFASTRALVRRERGRLAAGLGLVSALLALAGGLALFLGGAGSFSDTACMTRTLGTERNLEGGSIVQSAGLWPPGLRCRYQYRSGEVETYRVGFEGVWVSAAATAVFGAGVGLATVGLGARNGLDRSRP